MATLKDHQQAMVDLLASGSGIPASASRLAHAMHDVLSAILAEPDLMAKAIQESKAIRHAFTTPGLNDKALAGDLEACRPKATPAERRVKELENTVKQLRASNAKLRNAAMDTGASYADMGMRYAELVKILSFYGVDDLDKARAEYLKYNNEPEQAGCRKDDTQVCEHDWYKHESGARTGMQCLLCGVWK